MYRRWPTLNRLGILLGLCLQDLHHLRGPSSSELTTSVSQSGEFAFQDLAPGNYRISVNLPEHLKPWEQREITVPAKGCFEVDIRTAFNGRLAGRVTDKPGAPVPYVAVDVIGASEAAEAERSLQWQTADKDGAFELGPLPPDVLCNRREYR